MNCLPTRHTTWICFTGFLSLTTNQRKSKPSSGLHYTESNKHVLHLKRRRNTNQDPGAPNYTPCDSLPAGFPVLSGVQRHGIVALRKTNSWRAGYLRPTFLTARTISNGIGRCGRRSEIRPTFCGSHTARTTRNGLLSERMNPGQRMGNGKGQ